MGLIRRAAPEDKTVDERRSHPRNLQELLTQLRSGTAQERRWAARDLSGRQEAAEPLCQAFGEETELSVRAAIGDGLLAIGDESVVRGILPYLHSEDAGQRNFAVEILQKLPEVSSNYVEELLHHTDPDIRIFAINICQYLAHAPTTDWLLDVIRNDTHINVIATAIDGLAEIGTPEMTEELSALKRRFAGDPFICFAVDQAILRIQG